MNQIDPQHAVMRFKGQDILVETRSPLPRQVEILFQVEEVQPKVVLKMVPEGDTENRQIRSLLKRVLSTNPSLEEMSTSLSGLGKIKMDQIPEPAQKPFQELLALLKRFSFPFSSSSGSNSLSTLLAQSGLFWETKIKRLAEEGKEESLPGLIPGDLKGLVLALRSRLKSLPRQTIPGKDLALMDDLTRGLDQLAQKIEMVQILNLMHSGPQERFSFLLPLWIENRLQFVELNLSFPRREADSSEPEEISLFFLLLLAQWGKMKIEVKVNEKNLFCLFRCSDPGGSKYIHQALPDLSARLNQLGYHPDIQVRKESPEMMNQTFAGELQTGLESLLNIRV